MCHQVNKQAGALADMNEFSAGTDCVLLFKTLSLVPGGRTHPPVIDATRIKQFYPRCYAQSSLMYGARVTESATIQC